MWISRLVLEKQTKPSCIIHSQQFVQECGYCFTFTTAAHVTHLREVHKWQECLR